ncbi:MAG: Vps62-related protein [Pseudomonas sp.]|nr:Vps62-related protein [Pseudomonas sp.]
MGDYQNINQHKIVAVVSEVDKANGTALRMPDDFELVWKHSGPRVHTACSVWRPIAPDGYVAMGLVCGVGNDSNCNAPRSTSLREPTGMLYSPASATQQTAASLSAGTAQGVKAASIHCNSKR